MNCVKCGKPVIHGVGGYAAPQCMCWATPASTGPTLDVTGTLIQQSAVIDRLRAELAASRERFDKAFAAFEREQDRALAAEVRAESAETALAACREREARMREALDKIAWGRAPGPMNNKLAQQYEQIAVAALAEGARG